jgi:hypothetical protein
MKRYENHPCELPYTVFAAAAGTSYRAVVLLHNVILKTVGSYWSLNTKTVEIADAANIQCVGGGEHFQRPLPAIKLSTGCMQNNVTKAHWAFSLFRRSITQLAEPISDVKLEELL